MKHSLKHLLFFAFTVSSVVLTSCTSNSVKSSQTEVGHFDAEADALT